MIKQKAETIKKCPKCGSENLTMEKMLNGKTTCMDCGYRGIHHEFQKQIEKVGVVTHGEENIKALVSLIKNACIRYEQDGNNANISTIIEKSQELHTARIRYNAFSYASRGIKIISTAEALTLLKKGRIGSLTDEEYQSLIQYLEEGYEIEQQIFKLQIEASNKKCGL